MVEWITWEGGPRPVSPDTKIFIRVRNGFETKIKTAGRLNWYHADVGTDKELLEGTVHIDPDYDIVAYRVSE